MQGLEPGHPRSAPPFVEYQNLYRKPSMRRYQTLLWPATSAAREAIAIAGIASLIVFYIGNNS